MTDRKKVLESLNVIRDFVVDGKCCENDECDESKETEDIICPFPITIISYNISVV